MTPDQQRTAERVLKGLLRSLRLHDTRCARYDECDNVYNAVLKPPEREQWNSNLHPPFAWQVVETIVANIVEDAPSEKVIGLTPEGRAFEESVEHLIRYQRNLDDYDEKLPDFVRQAVVRGISVAKVPWLQEEAPVRKRLWRMQPSLEMGAPPEVVEEADEDVELVTDRPSFEVVNAKDFWWDEAATSMRDATCVYFRTYEKRSQLLAMQEAGLYENVDDIPEHAESGADDSENVKARGRIEVVECWEKTRRGIRLYVLADRKTLLRDEASPLHHGELPFVVACLAPSMFRFVGRSITDLIADLQAALWSNLNQRMDATALVANPIYWKDPTVEVPDALAPGTVVDALQSQFGQLQTNPSVIQPSLEAERTMQTMMQDITAANPYASGTSDPSTVDAKTATEISLVQNAAQRRFVMMKRQISYALRRVGRQQIKLNQQLLASPEEIRVTGDANMVRWVTVDPSQLQHRFDYEIEDVNESINRQERRLEAAAKIETLVALQPYLAQQGKQLNVVALVEDFTEAYGEAPDKYLMDAPPPVLPGLAPGGLGAAAPPPGLLGAGAAPTTTSTPVGGGVV